MLAELTDGHTVLRTALRTSPELRQGLALTGVLPAGSRVIVIPGATHTFCESQDALVAVVTDGVREHVAPRSGGTSWPSPRHGLPSC